MFGKYSENVWNALKIPCSCGEKCKSVKWEKSI